MSNIRIERIELPQPNHYQYYELPTALQLQIAALGHIEHAEGALDSAERDGRALEFGNASERDEWRAMQQDALLVWRLRSRLEARTVLAYVRWLIARTEEEGDGARGYHLGALRHAEEKTQTRLLALAQEA